MAFMQGQSWGKMLMLEREMLIYSNVLFVCRKELERQARGILFAGGRRIVAVNPEVDVPVARLRGRNMLAGIMDDTNFQRDWM